MNCTKLQELAAAHALGALDRADAARLEALVAEDPDAREELLTFQETSAALATALPAQRPSPALRAKILEQIASTSQAAATALAPGAATPGFCFVPNDDSGWRTTPIPGFRVKTLSISRDMGYQVLKAELTAGCSLPEHDHKSSEEIFAVSGHLHTEGRVLGPGDFLHAEPGTHHGELISPDGCVAILIQRAPVTA